MAKTSGGTAGKKGLGRKYTKPRRIMGGTVVGPAGAAAVASGVRAVVGPIGRALVRQYGYQVGMMGYSQAAVGPGRKAAQQAGLLPPGPKKRKTVKKSPQRR